MWGTRMLRRFFFTLIGLLLPLAFSAKLPEIDAQGVKRKLNEIMASHASVKQIDPIVAKRALNNYLELLDPSKTYFIKPDITQWVEPTDAQLEQLVKDYGSANYETFAAIQDAMGKAILRRRQLMKTITSDQLPAKVDRKEFKDPQWVASEPELIDRLKKIKALQRDVTEKMTPELKEKAAQRIDKYQAKYEDEILTSDPVKRKQEIFANVLKATASSFDTHTNYFTPDEASNF